MALAIQITGKNLPLTETLKADVNKKFLKLERHFSKLTSIHVTLGLDRVNHREQHVARAHIGLPHGEVNAESVSDDMYASIDTLIDKLDKQLIKHKQKMKEEGKDDLF